jgi:hypothetical protein
VSKKKESRWIAKRKQLMRRQKMRMMDYIGRAHHFVKKLVVFVMVLDDVILVSHNILVEVEASWRLHQDLKYGKRHLQWLWGQTTGIERDPQLCLSFQRSSLLMLQHDFVLFVQTRKE